MPKATYAKLDDIPEGLRDEYEEKGGVFHLKIEGDHPNFVPKAKLDEFRTNNIGLQKKLDDLKDVDPARYRQLIAEAEERKKKGQDNPDLEADLNRRVTAALEPVTKDRDNLKKDNERLNGELSKLKISDAAIAAGLTMGLRKTATEDLAERVNRVFKLEDGRPVAYDSKGDKIYGSTGSPITVEEYVKGLLESAPHLFDASNGSGASSGNGSSSSGTYSGINPWDSKTWNLSEQGRIYSKDPAQAKRLAAQAGKKLNF